MEQNRIDIDQKVIRGKVVGKKPTLYREYIGHIYGQMLAIFFGGGHVWPYIGHIWPWEALFFHRCARRDGGRAGRRPDVARIDEKN